MFFLHPLALFLFQATITSGSIHGGDEFAPNITSQMKLFRHLPLTALIQQYLLTSSLCLLPLCAMLYYSSEDCFWQKNLWAGLTASSCLAGMCPGAATGILPVEESGLVQLSLGNSQLVTSHNSISDFSGQSCPAQTTVCLPISYLLSFPNCSCLCFITAIQPVHSAELSTASSHLSTQFTATGTAPPKKKKHFTSPQFHRDTLPRLEQHHPPTLFTNSSIWYHYSGNGSSLP